MPTTHTKNWITRENRILWGPSPQRVIREFDLYLAARRVPGKMSAKATGEWFIRFCFERQQARGSKAVGH